jgi:hypothetical protein
VSSLFVQAPNVEVAPMHGETVLFHPDSNKFCLLNQTAALVWSMLEKPATLDALTAEICNRYEGTEPAKVMQDVREVIDRMQKLNFVAPQD